jgi:predicted Rossmann fold nucleotide-binding protein DprA/Smf involved in DNA uptake
MKICVAGSRKIKDKELVLKALSYAPQMTTLVSGGAEGVDTIAEEIAKEQNIPIERYLPDWHTHGKKAGYLRNRTMVDHCDFVIVVWDGNSKGSKHTMDIAIEKGKPVLVIMQDGILPDVPAGKCEMCGIGPLYVCDDCFRAP